MTGSPTAQRPEPDPLLGEIADYVLARGIDSTEAYDTARLCLMDSLACMMLALNFPACTKLLGPVVPGAEMKHGCRVPGTAYELDPVQAAFNIGALVRWLDYNDTWLAAEWGHPSDNVGAILACAYQPTENSGSVTRTAAEQVAKAQPGQHAGPFYCAQKTPAARCCRGQSLLLAWNNRWRGLCHGGAVESSAMDENPYRSPERPDKRRWPAQHLSYFGIHEVLTLLAIIAAFATCVALLLPKVKW